MHYLAPPQFSDAPPSVIRPADNPKPLSEEQLLSSCSNLGTATRAEFKATLERLHSASSKEPIFSPQAVLETHLYRNSPDFVGTSELATCLGLSFSHQEYLKGVSVIVIDGDVALEGPSDPKVLEAHSQLVQQIIATQANLKDENILTFRLNVADDREASLLSLLEAITEAREGHPPTVVVSFGNGFGINLSTVESDPVVHKPTAELHGFPRAISLSELQANPTAFLEGLKHLREVRPDLTNQADEALSQIALFRRITNFLSQHSSEARVFHGLPNIPRAQYAVHIPGSAADNHVLVGANNPSGDQASYSRPHSSYVEATGRGTVLYVPPDFKPANTSFNHSVLLVSSELMATSSGDLAGQFLDEKTLSVSEEQRVRYLARSIHSSKPSLTEKEAQLKELKELIKDRVLSLSVGYEVLGGVESYPVFDGVPLAKRWMHLTSLELKGDGPSSGSPSVAPLSHTGFLFASVTNSAGRSVLAPIETGHSWATPDHAGAELRRVQSNSSTAFAWRKLVDSLPALAFGTFVGSVITYLTASRGPKRLNTEDPE